MKKVILVHGWQGYPDRGWFKWIKAELEYKGFEVIAPKMPDTNNPKIGPWVSKLNEVVGDADEDTHFIGHSMGCQAILRYLETVNTRVGGVILVAGFIEPGSLTEESFDDEEDLEMARPWLETPIDYDKVKKAAKKIVAIFSDDDPYVPLFNASRFEDKLGAKIIIKEKQGHFSQGNGPKEVPTVVKELLKLA